MPRKFRVTIVLASFISSLLIPSALINKTEAASFSVSYDMTFTFKNNGSADVVQEISLKNLTSDLYASEYSLNIGSGEIHRVKGRDSLGSLSVSSKKTKNSTVLNAKINEKTIGKGKKTNFTLTYTIRNLATQKGRIWEVVAPGISTSEKLSSFKLKLKTPKSFGEIYSIYPNPTKQTTKNSFNHYIFNKKSEPGSTVVGYFGDYQNIEFNFTQKISNPNFFNKEERIMLPRDTFFQEVSFVDLNPRPDRIEEDADGNYFGVYSLSSGEEKEVKISGFVKVDKKIANELRETIDKNKNTENQRFWQVNSKSIIDKAGELKNTEEIYQYLVSTFSFAKEDLENNVGERLGAEAALVNPDGVLSSELVDLFISLVRAKNIPARQVIGFAFGKNKDSTPTVVNGEYGNTVLHTWVEYFDESENVWRQADPVWGLTRGLDYFWAQDPNRVALLIRGESSEEPKIPEFFSKLSESGEFEAKPTTESFNFSADPEINIELNKIVSGFPTVGKIIITNNSGKSLRGSVLNIQPGSVSILGENSRKLGNIAPFSQYTVSFKLRGGSVFNSTEDTIKAQLYGVDQGEKKQFVQEKTVVVKPFFSFNLPQALLIILLLVILAASSYPLYQRIRTRRGS